MSKPIVKEIPLVSFDEAAAFNTAAMEQWFLERNCSIEAGNHSTIDSRTTEERMSILRSYEIGIIPNFPDENNCTD